LAKIAVDEKYEKGGTVLICCFMGNIGEIWGAGHKGRG